MGHGEWVNRFPQFAQMDKKYFFYAFSADVTARNYLLRELLS
jgi:hypothetical protein